MAFDLQIAKIILGKDFQKIDAVIFRAFSCLAGHLEICLMWSLYGKLVNFVCNFVGNFSSRAALWCRYLSLDTCESSAHTHAFSDLSETSSESYTLAVQHLTRPGGNEQSEWFPFSYRGKRLQMCCLPLFFWLCTWDELSWWLPGPGRKFLSLQFPWEIFWFCLSLSACCGGSARQLHRFACPWVREDGTLSQIAR